MSNGPEVNVFKRLFDLRASIDKMIVDGTRDPEMVADELQKIVDVRNYLRRLYSDEVIPVLATDGTKTFANSDFVIGYIHPDYKPAHRPTEAVGVVVHELIRDGAFANFFGSLGETRPRFQTEHQIVVFCENNRDKLRGDGYANFFELEGGFVAYVLVHDDGRLYAFVHRLSRAYVWRAVARHRLVLPQQAL